MAPPTRAALPSKLYFRIGEVATLVGVEPHVLRYWEREFRTIRPTKSAKGQRVYSRRDVENLLRVRDLLYAEGFTIAGAKKQLQRGGLEPLDASDEETSAKVDGDAHVDAEREATPVPAPAAAPTPRGEPVRARLLALRAEVQAFLEELGG